MTPEFVHGLQIFCICCVPFGLAVMTTAPIKERTYKPKPPPRKGRKRKSATTRKPRTVASRPKKKQAKQEPKPWAKPPNYTKEDLWRIEDMFRRGRGQQTAWYNDYLIKTRRAAKPGASDWGGGDWPL